MSDEKLKILELLEQGKISADEAKNLLDALGEGGSASSSQSSSVPAKSKSGSGGKAKKRLLRVLVYEGDLNKPKVRVNIPLQLAKLAMKFVPEDKGKIDVNGKQISLGDLDLDEIIELASEVEDGKLVEVEDGDERVIISLE